MSEFFSAYSLPAREVRAATPIGSRELPTYGIRLDERGSKVVYETGKKDIYEFIQSSLEETKISNIIRRAVGGDPTALAAVRGQYLDVSAVPTNLMDFQNLMLRVQREFAQLSAAQREKFDNSVDRYAALYGSDEWASALGLKKEIVEQIPNPVEGGSIDGASA